MNILITGATGLVGSSLTHFLIQSGHTVHILSTRKKYSPTHKKIHAFYWSPQDGHIDMKAFENVEAVVHLAGASINQRWTTKAKRAILDSRVLSTRLLYDSIKKVNSIKHFVCASAIGIYPSHPSKKYTEQNTQTANSFSGEVVQKWEAEASHFRTLPLKVSILRIGLVLSDKGGALVPLVMPTRWGLGAWFGDGLQWQSWIHIHDLIRAIDFLIKKNLEGVYNATAPTPVSQRDLVKAIARTLGVPRWMPGIPKLPIRWIMGSMSSILFESLRVSPTALTDCGFTFAFPDIDSCLEDLLS